jgi:HAD superfamily hydrolase (TIGR01484 family)
MRQLAGTLQFVRNLKISDSPGVCEESQQDRWADATPLAGNLLKCEKLMTTARDRNSTHPVFLATDLDGTLIPLTMDSYHQQSLVLLADLLKRYEMPLAYVTGRHFASVQAAIAEFNLPQPDWILCDVGTSAWERGAAGEFLHVDRYAQKLQEIAGGIAQGPLLELSTAIPGLRPQESEKQAPFKISFYAARARLEEVVSQLRDCLNTMRASFQIISSVDPFTGEGLIDLLPIGVSKAFALEWLCGEQNWSQQSVIFAGDSGNDLAAFNADYNTIIVGNTADSIVAQVREAHRSAGWSSRLYHASQHATSGVLEGVLHFLEGR